MAALITPLPRHFGMLNIYATPHYIISFLIRQRRHLRRLRRHIY